MTAKQRHINYAGGGIFAEHHFVQFKDMKRKNQ